MDGVLRPYRQSVYMYTGSIMNTNYLALAFPAVLPQTPRLRLPPFLFPLLPLYNPITSTTKLQNYILTAIQFS